MFTQALWTNKREKQAKSSQLYNANWCPIVHLAIYQNHPTHNRS